MMDSIKMEPEVDPLELQEHVTTSELEDKMLSSEEGNLMNLQVKTEYLDHSYDIKSEIKVEDNAVPGLKFELEDRPVVIKREVAVQLVREYGMRYVATLQIVAVLLEVITPQWRNIRST
ncbi:uncharacterized protein [Periplaneta americana]|uniref:uncharacterized protein isoform X2 n=1 Tax=Periplaneta americana TaxID=6978 RepID=UPI0037E74561